jgi:hypothetical protein
MDFMIQLTWNSTVIILAQIYFLPPHSATYFTAVSEHKNALSAGKNIGFYHVLNEKLNCVSVAQQQKHIWDLEGVNKTPPDLLFLTSINNLRVLPLKPHIKCHSNYPI